MVPSICSGCKIFAISLTAILRQCVCLMQQYNNQTNIHYLKWSNHIKNVWTLWLPIPTTKLSDRNVKVPWGKLQRNVHNIVFKWPSNNNFTHDNTSVTKQLFILWLSLFTCFGLNRPSSGVFTLLKLLYCTEYHLFTSHAL
jgi:hypothetical protein